jgi:hypothetical protein
MKYQIPGPYDYVTLDDIRCYPSILDYLIDDNFATKGVYIGLGNYQENFAMRFSIIIHHRNMVFSMWDSGPYLIVDVMDRSNKTSDEFAIIHRDIGPLFMCIEEYRKSPMPPELWEWADG